MQTVLVTGATSGIGLTIANHLHKNGYRVLGTSRAPGRQQGQFPFELLELDLSSGESIQNCVTAFTAGEIRLDILINNAGIGINGSAEETSAELARKQFEINFWGTVNLTKAILPLMRQQRHGRIVTIGSLAGLIGVPFQSYYAASKHALEGFFKSLRLEVRPFNVKVSMVEPGFFKTNLNQAFEQDEPSIADYDATRDKALASFSSSIERAPTPEPVAKTVLAVLRSANPRYSYRVGSDAVSLPILQFLSYRFFEWGAAKKFSL